MAARSRPLKIDNEDLTFSLETVIERFAADMAPYAAGLAQQLAQQFWRITSSAEQGGDDEDDDGGDDGARWAWMVGCFWGVVRLVAPAAVHRISQEHTQQGCTLAARRLRSPAQSARPATPAFLSCRRTGCLRRAACDEHGAGEHPCAAAPVRAGECWEPPGLQGVTCTCTCRDFGWCWLGYMSAAAWLLADHMCCFTNCLLAYRHLLCSASGARSLFCRRWRTSCSPSWTSTPPLMGRTSSRR